MKVISVEMIKTQLVTLTQSLQAILSITSAIFLMTKAQMCATVRYKWSKEGLHLQYLPSEKAFLTHDVALKIAIDN